MINVLVVIDIQKEYVTEGRPFYIRNIGSSLKSAKATLEYARTKVWKIIHVQHIQEGNLFNPKSEFSSFVEGFEPKTGESAIIKGDFSCFSSTDFTHIMQDFRDSQIYIIGYGSGMCCLSTIIDGYHRGFKMNFVSDASSAKAKMFDEATTHAHMTDAISTFAKVLKSSEITI